MNRLGAAKLPRDAVHWLDRSWTISRPSNLQTLLLTVGGQQGFWVSKAWNQLFPHCFVGSWQPRDGSRHLPTIHCLAKLQSDCGRPHEGFLLGTNLCRFLLPGDQPLGFLHVYELWRKAKEMNML